MTLAELETKRDEILHSLGVARVQFGERSIQYDEQEKALALIDGEIAKSSGTVPARFSLARTSKG
jgi:hypothetical protein